MPLSETVFVASCLLGLAILAAGLFRRLPVPHTVLLVVLGFVLGELAAVWPPLAVLDEFELTPELVFFVLLPVLIFESGLNLDGRQLLRDIAPILTLAVPALLISTTLVGLGLWAGLGLDLAVALLFGALISATDPVAVVALFKELGAPLRLSVLVEGESLLNDATALVLFGILLVIVREGGPVGLEGAAGAVVDFVLVFAGGALTGFACGVAASEIQHRTGLGKAEVLALSIVLAYASFVAAEHLLHVSGVMAAGSAALTFAGLGTLRLPPATTALLGDAWEIFAFAGNSMLFLLVGLSIEHGTVVSALGGVALAVVLVMAARAVVIYGMVPVTLRGFRLPAVSLAERHIMWWGGLKGGLAIAMVLSIPDYVPGRELLLNLTLGVVMFTLVVNAATVRPLMLRLGLDRLDEEEAAELTAGLERTRREADAAAFRLQQAGIVSRGALHRAQARFADVLGSRERERRVDAPADPYFAALRVESETLKACYETGLVNQYTYLEMRNVLAHDRDRHRAGTRGAPCHEPHNVFHRLETALLAWLRERDWASGWLARYQRQRLAQYLERNAAGAMMSEAAMEALAQLREMDGDAMDGDVIARLEGIYRERLTRRRERLRAARADFREFYRAFERDLLARVGLRAARTEVERLHDRHELGGKAYTLVEQRIVRALAAVSAAGAEVQSLPPADLLGQVPLLAGLSGEAIGACATHARALSFLAGDTVVAEGERGDALYVVVHGDLDVFRSEAQSSECAVGALHEGDFFGEMALLGDSRRSASVRAATNCSCLRLERRDVLDVAERFPELRERLESVRAERLAEHGEAG